MPFGVLDSASNWPTYDDGTPVSIGDNVYYRYPNDTSMAVEYITFDDSSYSVSDNEGRSIRIPYNLDIHLSRHLSRAVTPCLTADTKNISVGDTVFNINSGKKYVVKSIQNDSGGKSPLVRVKESDGGRKACYYAHELSSDYPVWEGIADLLHKTLYDYCMRYGIGKMTFSECKSGMIKDIINFVKES